MPTEVIETHMNNRREVVATLPTFAEAKAYVAGLAEVVDMIDDADYPGCADAFLADGRLFAIQPVGFKVGA